MLKGYRTIIGIVIAAVIALGETLGVAPVEALPDWLAAIIALLGAILGVYGRAAADTPIFRGE